MILYQNLNKIYKKNKIKKETDLNHKSLQLIFSQPIISINLQHPSTFRLFPDIINHLIKSLEGR